MKLQLANIPDAESLNATFKNKASSIAIWGRLFLFRGRFDMPPQTASRKATLFREQVSSKFRAAADVVASKIRKLLNLLKLSGTKLLNHLSRK